MPNETTLRHLAIPLWLLPVFMLAQTPAPPTCGFDPAHGRHLAGDAAYRRRHNEQETLILERARQRLDTPAATFREEEEVLTVPVVVHVFYPPGARAGSANRPSFDQVRQTIERLNDAFRYRDQYAGGPYFSNAGISGIDVGIEFQLARQDPGGLPSDGLRLAASPLADMPIDGRVNGVEVLDSLRRLSGWPPGRYLNIYVRPALCDRWGDCPAGFAYQAAAHGRDFDGVYVSAQAMAGEAEILIHEVGHYLNLYHTFEGDCSELDCLNGGDRVCDTPPDCFPGNCGGALANCLQEQRQNTCHNDADIANSPFTTDVEDLYENFMDYGFWRCFNSFTPGQRTRMREALLLFRSSLLPSPPKQGADTCRIDTIELLAFDDTCPKTTDTAWATLRIGFATAPDSGMLVVNGFRFPMMPSPQQIRIPLPSGEAAVDVEAYFSAAPGCRQLAPALIPARPCPWADRCRLAPLLPVAQSGPCAEGLTLPATAGAPPPLSGWPAACAAYAGGERWLRLVAPPSGALTVRAAGTASLALAAFDECDGNALYGCAAPADGTAELTLTGLLPGDTLLLAVWPTGVPVTGDIHLCAFAISAPPANDDCAGAIFLPISDSRLGQTCSATVTVDWTGARPGSPPLPCDEPVNRPDVWFYTLAPADGRLQLQPIGAGAPHTGLAAYTGCDTPPLACGRLTDRGRPELLVDNRMPGDTLFIRLWPTTATPGVVRLCSTSPPAIAPNDECDAAMLLPVASRADKRQPLLVGNVIATSSGRRNTCEGETADDLWYRLVVPAEGTVVIEATVAAGIISPSLAAYAGCQGAEIACNSSQGDRVSLMLEGLLPGDTLLVALWDFFGFRFGSAELSAYPLPPPEHDECSAPLPLPLIPDSTQAYLMLSDLIRATPSAGTTACRDAKADLWYSLPTPADGRLVLELLPLSDAPAGLAVYLDCGQEPLACLAAGERRLLSGLPPNQPLLLSVWADANGVALRAFAPPPCPVLDLEMHQPACAGETSGVISVRDEPGFSYRWDNGQTGARLSAVPAGAYRLVASGPYGCRDTLEAVIAEPPPLLVRFEHTPAMDGHPGSLRATAAGGTPPYSYFLNESAGREQGRFDSLAAGAYLLTIRDANGCTHAEIVTIDQLTATPLPEKLMNLRIFPNPASNLLRVDISLRQANPLRLTIRDGQGRRIAARQLAAVAAQHLTWDVSGWAAGVYLLQLEMAGQQVSRRFVVTR